MDFRKIYVALDCNRQSASYSPKCSKEWSQANNNTRKCFGHIVFQKWSFICVQGERVKSIEINFVVILYLLNKISFRIETSRNY